MKNLSSPLTKIFALLIISLFILPSCKKGPDDPAISIRSRKSRLVGDWRLKSGNAGLTLLDPKNPPFAQSFVFDGSKATATETQASGPPTIYIFAYLAHINIKKDGTFTLSETYGSYTLLASGKWNFTSGIGENKNKEEVLFIIEDVSNDETTGHLFNKQSTEFTYKILKLKNKELRLEAGTKEYINADGKNISFSGTYEFIQG